MTSQQKNSCPIDPFPKNYDRFVNAVVTTARMLIPRWRINNYVPGLTTYPAGQYKEYIQFYEQDPFGVRRTSTDADSGIVENVANTYWEHWYDAQQ